LVSPFGNFGIGAVVNELIQQQNHDHGIRAIDNRLSGGLSSWKGKLAEDHFHPNDKGYREFALLFYEALVRELEH
jgi:lysophospholipase L1-like esterase